MANPHTVLQRLRKIYKKTDETFVRWRTPLQLVIAVVLSAQCTDKRVNMVTRGLFAKYKSAEDYAKASVPALRKEIHSITFFNAKTKYLKGIGKRLVGAYGGKVPAKLEDLLTLPGVSYKSAHLILAKAFGISVGVAVDTHVQRVAPRLGWTKEKKNPRRMGKNLDRLFPPKDYLDVNEFLIMHGRAICKPRPLCETCPLNDICPTGKKRLGA
ncbi:endonuclease III [Candidatus Uhrbacteria bacterium]|nr:endonuclease III [Candidatus Uhrbacteria bacterium]